MSPTKSLWDKPGQSFSTHPAAKNVLLSGNSFETTAHEAPSASEANERVNVTGVQARMTKCVSPVLIQNTPDPPGTVVRSSLVAEKNIVSQPTTIPSSIEPSIKDKVWRRICTEPTDQGAQSENPALQQTTKASGDPSPVDGPSESAPIATATQMLDTERAVPGRDRDPRVKFGPFAKGTSKKKRGGTKTGIPKTLGTLQHSERGQSSAGGPHSENVKPPSDSQPETTEKPFLEKAAFSEHEDDAAKTGGAEMSEPELSTATISARPASDPKHSLETLSIIASEIAEARKTPAVAQSLSSMTDTHTVTDSIEKPSGHDQSTTEDIPSNHVSRPTTDAITNVIRSEVPECEAAVDDSGRHGSQAMTREVSNTTNCREESTLFEHTSSVQSSFLQTERSNSIADASQPSIIHSSGLSRNEQTRDTGFDAENLRMLLSAAEKDGGHTEDTLVEPVLADRRQSSATASDLQKSSEGSEREESHVLPLMSPADGVVHIEPTKGISAQDSSIVSTDNDLKPETFKITTTMRPEKRSESALNFIPPYALPSDSTRLQSKSPEDKKTPAIPPRSSSLQSVSAPIQTRQKKKPKQFPPVEENNDSKLVAEEPLQANKQSLVSQSLS